MKGSFHKNLNSHPFLKSVPSVTVIVNSIKIYQVSIFCVNKDKSLRKTINVRDRKASHETDMSFSTFKDTQNQWRHSAFFIVNFEHISHYVLVFLLLTLSR